MVKMNATLELLVANALKTFDLEPCGKIKLENRLDVRLQYLLCNAMEGGSGYWISSTKYTYPAGLDKASVEYPHLEVPFMKGGSILISAEDHANPDRKDGRWLLNHEALLNGWAVMADKAPRHFLDAINENDDAGTGDVFLQCCLFGEVIFG